MTRAARPPPAPPRRRFRPPLAPLLLGALAALPPGCGEPIDLASQGEGRPPATPAPGYPAHLDLADGTRLTLAAPPQRVVAANAGALELLADLLPPERIVALPEPALPYLDLVPGHPLLARPRFAAYEAEPLLALVPDLVVTHTWQRAETAERLREAGVPVAVLADPQGWEETRAQLLAVGRLLGVDARAEELAAAYDARVAALAARGESLSRVTALCYSNGGAGGWVAAGGTTNHEMLRLAGLRDLAAESGRVGHVPLAFEELLVLDPDLLVVGGSLEGGRPGSTATLLRTEPALAGLRAVREQRVLVLPGRHYTAVSHNLVDAAEALQREALQLLAQSPLP